MEMDGNFQWKGNNDLSPCGMCSAGRACLWPSFGIVVSGPARRPLSWCAAVTILTFWMIRLALWAARSSFTIQTASQFVKVMSGAMFVNVTLLFRIPPLESKAQDVAPHSRVCKIHSQELWFRSSMENFHPQCETPSQLMHQTLCIAPLSSCRTEWQKWMIVKKFHQIYCLT